MPTLRKLVDRYFLTEVGDLAADRLGDALFEQGNFSAAERLWRMVVEKYPDSHLSTVKLQVKRCVALSRLGRRNALARLAADIREQDADRKVTIGGKEVAAADFVQSLLSAGSPISRVSPLSGAGPAAVTAPFTLPAGGDPLWKIQVSVLNTAGRYNMQTGMAMPTALRVAPSGAVDGQRFYANWLGTIYAADLTTGKMLWRTGKFTEGMQRGINYLQQGMTAESFFLESAGGKLYVLRQPTKNLLGELLGAPPVENGQLALECLDAKTGRTAWSARNLNATIVSAPYLYQWLGAVARHFAAECDDATLGAIDAATGKVEMENRSRHAPELQQWPRGIQFRRAEAAHLGRHDLRGHR